METTYGALMERCFNDARKIAEHSHFGKVDSEELTKARAQYVQQIAFQIYEVEKFRLIDAAKNNAIAFLEWLCKTYGLDYDTVKDYCDSTDAIDWSLVEIASFKK